MAGHVRWAGAMLTAVLTAALAGCENFHWPTMGGETPQLDDQQGPREVTGSGQWVIILGEFRDVARYDNASKLKKLLLGRHWHSVGVMNDPATQASYVYYGPFKYGTEITKNLKAVREYVITGDGGPVRPFDLAYMRELPPPNPPAPPEYNLASAPPWAFWSLQIAHYVDPGPAFPATELMKLPPDWNRKQAAVETCTDLRKQGYPAYYYHTVKMSMVTVGAFPADVCQYFAGPPARYIGYDPDNFEYDNPLVKRLRNTTVKNAEGKDEPIFAYNLENGVKVIKVHHYRDGRTVRQPAPSFLVQIPRPGHDIEGPDAIR